MGQQYREASRLYDVDKCKRHVMQHHTDVLPANQALTINVLKCDVQYQVNNDHLAVPGGGAPIEIYLPGTLSALGSALDYAIGQWNSALALTGINFVATVTGLHGVRRVPDVRLSTKLVIYWAWTTIHRAAAESTTQ